MIEAHGCRFEKLPPHPPDFNPIELSFSVIKRVVKNQYQIQGDEAPVEFTRLVGHILGEVF